MSHDITRRKLEHIEAALTTNLTVVQQASWSDIHLIHRALPEVDLDEIDTSVEFLGKRLRAPLFITSITGGHADVAIINERLARAAERFGVAMGVGSQRAGIASPELAYTYSIVREQAPTAFLIANIGAPQLIPQAKKQPYTIADARTAIQMIHADALAVHLNYLQEAAQPEGDRNARGVVAALASLTAAIETPVIAKETGAGISKEQALILRDAGVQAIDVGGAGGSSMAAMERVRAEKRGDRITQAVGELYGDWGIATPISIVEAGVAQLPLISTGGVRSGLDAARAIALGATLVGIGFPLLKAAMDSDDAVTAYLEGFFTELNVAMQLTGSAALADLRATQVVVTGETRSWLELRGFGSQLVQMAQR